MSGARSQRRPQANAKKTKQKQKEPETFDDFMSEGIEFEERGERYRTGDRAQRSYEQAAKMYEKANALKPEDADCLYNWGRVLYLLVGFLPAQVSPEQKLELLDRSIEKFRAALVREPNRTDAQFNLGQALHSRSEILQETSDIENSYTQSAVALQEAISLFETLYDAQEKEYREQRMETKNNKQEQPVQEQPEGEEEEGYQTVTQVEPTTAYSLIDTLVCMADAMTTMASMLASFKTSVDLFSRARSKLSLAEKWLSDTCKEDKEHKAARIQINLKEAQNFASLAERSFLATAQVDHALFRQAIDRLDEIVDQFDPRNVEAMCDKGDILASYAESLLKQNLEPETTGKQVWQIYAQADKSFKAALNIEPKTLNILNKLGDLSMARAKLPIPVAERNKVQLLKNAEFYYKQAVEINREVLKSGWIGWAFSAWALEEWAQINGKKDESAKIMRSWIRRGGSAEMFGDITEDGETLDPDFITWINDSVFEQEDDDE